jgi:hypothetical protein
MKMADLIDDVRREGSQHLALRVKAEIDRLQDAKRAALAIADERSKENVKLRTALEKLWEWNEGIQDNRGNHHPEDHLSVIRDALQSPAHG